MCPDNHNVTVSILNCHCCSDHRPQSANENSFNYHMNIMCLDCEHLWQITYKFDHLWQITYQETPQRHNL